MRRILSLVLAAVFLLGAATLLPAAAAIIVPLVHQAQIAHGIELCAPEQYENTP